MLNQSSFSMLAIALAFAPTGVAQNTSFDKTRYSSAMHPIEVEVHFTVADSKISIKSKKVNKNLPPVEIEIPYSSIDAMSYELATRHRVSEGAMVMVASLGAGAIVMATKTKSHWLVIQHHDSDAKQSTVLRLDKSEYSSVITALEAKTGKHIFVLDAKTSSSNPTAKGKNMDELVPFGIEKVMAALRPAMESEGCKVTEATSTRIECKRKSAG